MPHCRCSHCGSRRTLARHPDTYVRVPPCRSCGRKRWRVDRYRDRVELARKPCDCGYGYAFPHAKGRGWCRYNDKLTLDDWERWHKERYGESS